MSGSREVEADTLARACTAKMWADDTASQSLGMSLDSVGGGTATVSMVVTVNMLNGHRTCHGGYIFTLADTAFAFACNSRNDIAVAQHCTITFINPVQVGDRLTATGRELSRRGRSGIYDVQIVNQDGTHIAEFRGHSRSTGGQHVPGA